MKALGVILALALVLTAALSGQAEAVTCELTGAALQCDGSDYEISWGYILLGCTADFTIQRRCGTSGSWTTIAENVEDSPYIDSPLQGCLAGCFQYRVVINCDCECTEPCTAVTTCEWCP